MKNHDPAYTKGLRTKALNKLQKILEADEIYLSTFSTPKEIQGFWIGLKDSFWETGYFSKLVLFIEGEVYEKLTPFSSDKRFIARFEGEMVDTLGQLLKLRLQYENFIQKKFILSETGNETYPERPVYTQLDAQLAQAEACAISSYDYDLKVIF